MAFPIQLADRFGQTFLDFWRLRPRQFFEQKQRTPDAYLSPYEFLVVAQGLVFSMLLVSITLSATAVQAISGASPGDPKSLAGRFVVGFIVLVVGSSVLETLISRVWPIRKKTAFVEIFEFNCYLQAVLLPAAAIDVLVDPTLTQLIAGNVLPNWTLIIPLLLGSVIGFVFYFAYTVPGLAYINGVSYWRMLAGTIFWPAIVSFSISFVGGFWYGYKLATS
jgi:hypothetical protein